MSNLPHTIREINALGDEKRREIYRQLVPNWLTKDYQIGDINNPTILSLIAPERSRAVELALRRYDTERDPVLYINMADTFNHQILVLLVIVNDPNSERYSIDVDLQGNNTNFGTTSRNIPAEVAAKQAGLAPGQIRRGLRAFKRSVPVFEDFIAGFLEKHFSNDWEVKYQKSEMNLTDEYAFRMQHDIFLTSKLLPSRQIIVDTKYKLRGDFKSDNKRGISQSDMYQMASYALRRGCTEVLLLYPNQSDQLLPEDHFTISSGFNKDHKINITAAEIPFWSSNTHSDIPWKLHSRLAELLSRKEPITFPST